MKENNLEEKYCLNLINRNFLEITGVTNVESFDEEQIALLTNIGPLLIKGNGLHITQLNLERGNISIVGLVDEMKYLEENEKYKKKGKGIIQRILK